MTMLRHFRAALAAALLCAAPAQAADSEIEQRVKAAFLFNFVKFVDWPQQRFASAESPIALCMLPDDPLGPVLEQTLLDKTVDGRPLVVRWPVDAAGWAGCHLAYLDSAPLALMEAVLADVAGSAVLTVHEHGDALIGGVIRLYLEERKLRFEINTQAAQYENLKLSSKLMSLATVVHK